MLFPRSLEDLIESFKKLPGIGEKSAERMAFAVLNFSDDDVEQFGESLLNIKESIKHCSICGSLTDNDICHVCNDKGRNNKKLLVVKDFKDVFTFEKMGTFNCLYHVLGGLISPIDEIGPDDLNIAKLISRIKEGFIEEIILAISSGIEADMTALYIKKVLSDYNVSVTRIASGIPIGADMDYIDSLTLESALNNRKEVLDD